MPRIESVSGHGGKTSFRTCCSFNVAELRPSSIRVAYRVPEMMVHSDSREVQFAAGLGSRCIPEVTAVPGSRSNIAEW